MKKKTKKNTKTLILNYNYIKQQENPTNTRKNKLITIFQVDRKKTTIKKTNMLILYIFSIY